MDLPRIAILRLLLVLYAAYGLVVLLVPKNIIFAVSGTFLLTWRAPWVRTTRFIILSNGWVKYIRRRIWEVATGTTPTPPTSEGSASISTSPSLLKTPSANKQALSFAVPSHVGVPVAATPLRFRFSIEENQRWWMGLDWTAALLPQERASWTSLSPASKPVPPPMVITLPPSTSVLLPLDSSSQVS